MVLKEKLSEINWFLIIFLFSGTFMFFKTYEEFEKTNFLLNYGVETEAIVTANVSHSSSEGTSYKPEFEYQDASRTTRVAQGDVSTNPPSYSIGEKVRLIYNPDDFKQVKVVSFWGLHGSFIISLILGISHFSVGAIYYGRKIYLAFTSSDRP
jgi:hypothetical protein